MKKIFILVAFIGFSAYSFCQDIFEPQPLWFTFRDSFGVTHLRDTLKYDYFPQKRFIVGWQWGQHPRITSEILSDMFQTTYNWGW